MYCAVIEALLQVTTQRIQQNPDTNCCSLPPPPPPPFLSPLISLFLVLCKRDQLFLPYTSALLYVCIYILTFKTDP